MLYVNQMRGKSLVDINSGNRYGHIVNVLFDNCLTHFTAIETTSGYFTVDKLYSCNNVVTASGCKETSNKGITAVGKEILTQSGKRIAVVTDIAIDGDVKKIVTNNKSISPSKVLVAGDVILLKRPSKPTAVPLKNSTKCSGNFNFLVGRRTDKTILHNNEVIVRQHTVITPDIVRRAAQYGKLIELSLHAN